MSNSLFQVSSEYECIIGQGLHDLNKTTIRNSYISTYILVLLCFAAYNGMPC